MFFMVVILTQYMYDAHPMIRTKFFAMVLMYHVGMSLTQKIKRTHVFCDKNRT